MRVWALQGLFVSSYHSVTEYMAAIFGVLRSGVVARARGLV